MAEVVEWNGYRIVDGLLDLPDGHIEEGSLNLSYCRSLTSLPSGLEVGTWLNLEKCTSLKSLPDGLKVGSSIHLNGCTSLTSLPDGLTVEGSLELEGCTSLASLPENLTVSGHLYLSGCASLTFLPESLRVDGMVNVDGCKSLHVLPKSKFFECLELNDDIYIAVYDDPEATSFLSMGMQIPETQKNTMIGKRVIDVVDHYLFRDHWIGEMIVIGFDLDGDLMICHPERAR